MNLTTVPPVFTYAEARAHGLTRRGLQSAVDEGRLLWLSHGWYGVPGEYEGMERWEAVHAEHVARARFELARHRGAVASHTTAALLHGLAISIAPETPVDITIVDGTPRSRRKPGLVIHHSDSLEHSTARIDGVAVTTLRRTVADFLRSRGLPHGVALVDDALRRGLFEVDDIEQVLDRQVRWKGRPRALGALQIVDPGRETWAESYSFAALHLQGIALPIPQVNVFDDEYTFLGRVDALWPQVGVVGECDGEAKYFLTDDADAGSRATPEQTALRRLEAEAIRQERMTRIGLTFVRWTPAQIRDDVDAVAGRLRRVLASADPRRFSGWVEWEGTLRRLPFDVPRPALNLESLRTSRRQDRRWYA